MHPQKKMQKSMALQTKFRIKGQEYSLSLDTTKPDRNYDDENYAEWFISAEDGRLLEITVWKNLDGSFSHDGTVEAYKNEGDFQNGMLLDMKKIKIRLKEHEDTTTSPQQERISEGDASL